MAIALTEEVKKQKNRHVRVAQKHLTEQRAALQVKVDALTEEIEGIDAALKALE